jgi:predicted O-linked N-acetylglucosamine transferase (SPINDLY family)
LASAIRDDAIDILVELSGHTKGQRLQALVRRPAPVQVTYLGYPNTTGLPQIDFRITDSRADPPGESDRLHVERLIRLPECFLCYTPPETPTEVHASPVARNGYITFGSFNNCAKISATTIALWARVLSALPNSKLLIKSWGLLDPGLRLLLVERFREAGIPAGRIQVAPPTASHREHMDNYSEVDIALDTFPYHGTTTTLDALWMGVPVVTLAGDRHLSRVGVSILSALALDQLIAQTPEDYLDKATGLASDLSRLTELRGTLRGRLASSRVTDGQRFTAALEMAYSEMLASLDA